MTVTSVVMLCIGCKKKIRHHVHNVYIMYIFDVAKVKITGETC